jgi:hypothetical protein
MTYSKIIYIAGYGRSGSTLLDVLLGNHPMIFSAGELTNFFNEYALNKNCSCGRTYNNCQMWSQIVRRFLEENCDTDLNIADEITKKNERILRFKRNDGIYCKIWNSAVRAILQQSNTSIIVDSSKTTRVTFRRVPLFKKCGFHVSVIHLVRDPRAVMWSIKRGSNRLLEAGEKANLLGGMLRGLLGWIVSNLLFECTKLIHKPPCLIVRYEDLVGFPARELNRIGRFTGIDMQSVIDRISKGDQFNPGHGVSGNRMRRKGAVRIMKDSQWREVLPLWGRFLALLSLPLANRYGYNLFRNFNKN